MKCSQRCKKYNFRLIFIKIHITLNYIYFHLIKMYNFTLYVSISFLMDHIAFNSCIFIILFLAGFQKLFFDTVVTWKKN